MCQTFLYFFYNAMLDHWEKYGFYGDKNSTVNFRLLRYGNQNTGPRQMKKQSGKVFCLLFLAGCAKIHNAAKIFVLLLWGKWTWTHISFELQVFFFTCRIDGWLIDHSFDIIYFRFYLLEFLLIEKVVTYFADIIFHIQFFSCYFFFFFLLNQL